MKDLIDALSQTNRESAFLIDLIADAMQDGQYSPEARKTSIILQKYEPQYGRHTVREIREIYRQHKKGVYP
jgi:hypothetical protein